MSIEPAHDLSTATCRLLRLKVGDFLIVTFNEIEYVASISLSYADKKIKYIWITEISPDISEIANEHNGGLVNVLLKSDEELKSSQISP
jgi:hypothetical protein